jgi:hypothetical protein
MNGSFDAVEDAVAVGSAKRVGMRILPATTSPGETLIDSTTKEACGIYLDALATPGRNLVRVALVPFKGCKSYEPAHRSSWGRSSWIGANSDL